MRAVMDFVEKFLDEHAEVVGYLGWALGCLIALATCWLCVRWCNDQLERNARAEADAAEAAAKARRVEEGLNK